MALQVNPPLSKVCLAEWGMKAGLSPKSNHDWSTSSFPFVTIIQPSQWKIQWVLWDCCWKWPYMSALYPRNSPFYLRDELSQGYRNFARCASFAVLISINSIWVITIPPIPSIDNLPKSMRLIFAFRSAHKSNYYVVFSRVVTQPISYRAVISGSRAHMLGPRIVTYAVIPFLALHLMDFRVKFASTKFINDAPWKQSIIASGPLLQV